jgi:Flp pilus assembly protein TadG
MMWLIDEKKRIRQVRHRVQGVAAVEFALLITLLLLIVAGIIEFGRTFWYYDALAKSTRDAARYVSNTRFSSELAVDEDVVKFRARQMILDAADAAGVPNFSEGLVDVTCDPNCTAPNYVTVSILAYPVTIGEWLPIIAPDGALTWDVKLSPATTMRYMR